MECVLVMRPDGIPPQFRQWNCYQWANSFPSFKSAPRGHELVTGGGGKYNKKSRRIPSPGILSIKLSVLYSWPAGLTARHEYTPLSDAVTPMILMPPWFLANRTRWLPNNLYSQTVRPQTEPTQVDLGRLGHRKSSLIAVDPPLNLKRQRDFDHLYFIVMIEAYSTNKSKLNLTTT